MAVAHELTPPANIYEGTGQLSVAVPTVGFESLAVTFAVPRSVFVPRLKNWT